MQLSIILLITREVHIISAVILVGSIVFNYFFLRPALNKIPPGHGVVVSQRVGTLFTIIGMSCLGLLLASGITRLILTGASSDLLNPYFYLGRYGRWIAVMFISWVAVLTDSIIMTFLLRPKLINKLTLDPNPTLVDVENRRTTQLAASNLIDRLQLINVIFGVLAILVGASLLMGGFI